MEKGGDHMAKKKILIVDDDQDLLMGLRARLEANDYATVSATDAGSAIDTALKEKPDLILLDLGLPEDNGFIVMQRLQKLESLASTPVIVLTGRSPQVYKDPVLLAGAKGYLQKPIDNDKLLSTIRKALADSPGPKEGGMAKA